MDGNFPEKRYPFNLDLIVRRGVGRMLFCSICALVWIPLSLIGWISHHTAAGSLEKEIRQTVRVAAEIKGQHLEGYLAGRLLDAERQGRESATIAFFNALMRRQTANDAPPGASLKSPPWITGLSGHGADIQLHAEVHGYSDILLLDPSGTIIFPTTRPNDLTVNVNGKEAGTGDLAEAFLNTLETGKPAFVGFVPDTAANGDLRAVLISAIGRVDETPLGVIAFIIPGRTFQQLLDAPSESTLNPSAYLVDADLRLVAGRVDGQHPDGAFTVNTAVTRLWQKHRTDVQAASNQTTPLIYSGPNGRPVTGTFAPIQSGNRSYALIVEIDRKAAFAATDRMGKTILVILILTAVSVLVLSAGLARIIVGPVHDLTESMAMTANGVMDVDIPITARDELGQLASACGRAVDQFKALKIDHETQSHFMAGIASLQRLIGGEQELGELSLKTLEFLSDFLDLRQAELYIMNENECLECICHFPGQAACEGERIYPLGEGRVGQAALVKALAAFRKDDEIGSVMPVPSADLANLVVVPLILHQTVSGVMELEKTTVFTLSDCRYLDSATELIAMALGAAFTRRQEMALLVQTQEQAKKLMIREAALEASTRELQAQSRAFQASEQTLQLKQLELEAANAQMIKNAADLEANMAILERQKLDMQRQNAELEKTHRQLAEKARQLEISSRYKTEFMANMSHELRTPLNSILLLSRLLLENKEKTLTARQSEFTQTIYSAGEDLLNLINEILDLAKVESGKMTMELVSVNLKSIAKAMQVSFAPLAEQSGLAFTVQVAPDVPDQFISDHKRIEQIIKNFLSNAFKFTAHGSIRLELHVQRKSVGDNSADCICLSVVDTGIGIPADKHAMVFEAFQQVDGTTRRKYGGTGLGLSISRELARMLGGEITLESDPGKGSRFTLVLPMHPLPSIEHMAIRSQDAIPHPLPETAPPQAQSTETDRHAGQEWVPDDRHKLSPGEKSILIIEADPVAIDAIKTSAHQNGFRVLVAEKIRTGLHFADYYVPTAVFAALHLPGADGWRLVHQIKANPKCRQIPIFTLSNLADAFTAALHGAAGHIQLPPSRHLLDAAFQRIDDWRASTARTVLVVDPDPRAADRIGGAIGGQTIHFIAATTADAAAAILGEHHVHATILNPTLADTDQERLLKAVWEAPMPVLLYSENHQEPQYRSSATLCRDGGNLQFIVTPDELLSTLVAYLNLPLDALGEACRNRLGAINHLHASLKGRKVLLVDDDMRTVFAVTSALEDQGIDVYTGKSGKESLDKLGSFPDIDLILMDVMISEVDGYQAIREIRDGARFNDIPIIALTAKAMQGDRAKCIDAGADDYLAKPVNLDKLISMLKIWLCH